MYYIILCFYLSGYIHFDMTDTHSKEVRSYNMSRIRSKDTKPEILVREYLFKNGFRYRLNVKYLPGKPDIVLRKYKTIIFVNGCFWHGHEGCKYYVLPKTKTDWWLEKISKTQKRDQEAQIALKNMSWNIIVIWECQLKKEFKNKTLSELNTLLCKILLDSYSLK